MATTAHRLGLAAKTNVPVASCAPPSCRRQPRDAMAAVANGGEGPSTKRAKLDAAAR